ncbi:hypothetical protein DNH61_15290 [Paenibacillus sambharensis]|uniref:AIM24 family protein n=1 Tax=Paenibacillus sambharensis TaxID=1803190 RepID=A0A2W1LIV3_9BACL|nr:AIM24 family protein [Paenibacillus sambharensis]PZD95002.1 hypothetical protein DNH61_15290 [Paenibacillus sambharensis]
MKVTAPQPVGHVRVELENGEVLHVLHPKSVIAYQGPPGHREDKITDLADAYRKKRWIRSRMRGPSEFIIGLPPGCMLQTIDIEEGGDLLFDFRHVLFFTEGIGTATRVQKIKTAWITRELIRIRFSGPGQLGVITTGDLVPMQLQPETPLFVEAGSLVAYPESAKVKLSVYGNQIASQHMNVQWQLTGRGPVLIQTGSRDQALTEELQGGGFVKRLLRELLPFGGVYIK